MFALTVCCITGAAVFLSVLLKPNFYIGKIKIGSYWLISLVGAAILIISGSIPLDYLTSELTASTSINPLKILVLFFSMTSMSVFLDEAGFFRYLANLALRKTGKSQTRLFFALYAVVSVLTMFTSNDIVVLTFTPFICFFAKNAKVNPLPYLFAEFVASNTWSMLLIIGNPTNIYLASAAGIDFVSYASVMLIPTCFAGAVSCLILYLLFRKKLSVPIDADVQPEEMRDKLAVWLGAVHLGLCTVLLAISSYIDLEMYLIAATFGVSLFVCSLVIGAVKKKSPTLVVESFKRLPYELIPFVLSMFVLVLSLNYSGTTEKISEVLLSGAPVYTVGIASFFVSNVINNIPMSVLFSAILNVGTTGTASLANVYAAIIGSNVGAFFTPVGALAGIMWASILKKFDVGFSFRTFVVYGTIISVPVLMSALFGLTLVI